ncbi:uncharacterized protein LOC111696271 [Eurytemora carolleeae]|uniref:uncharacterized protein LOC111696271 n=1 Tax=Eurytemora carolleeae TaxID=1294199 RepID=UPI000C76B883|nr:uncharacterized protein LOC111696271 [Eurytemora carolleeae]|eukprot:XP_023321595.1 uncharacterized protein LOC111696271 [Eurytemora affinis]
MLRFLECLTITILIGSVDISSKLILNSLEDVLKDNDVDYSRLKEEAELISSTRKISKRCPEVEEIEELFQVWIQTQDGLKKEHIETSTYVDTIDDSTRIHNALDPWIYSDIVIRPLLNCVDAAHPVLLKHLKDRILHEPSSSSYNWSTSQPSLGGQFGQPRFLDMVIFKGKVKNGFFIEAGADDFESDSNSVYFELKHDWSGILVEPNPTIFTLGLSKGRKAWSAGTCLGLTDKPSISHFSQKAIEDGMAGLVPEENDNSFKIQCFPLYSLILATGNRTVNYLSLDIEGAEFQVLKSIPWNKVDIEVLTVETNHAGQIFPGSQEELRQYMKEKGYVLAYTVDIDDVFVRKDLYEGKYKPDLNMIKKFEKLYSSSCDWDGNGRVEFYRIVTQALHNRSRHISSTS